MRSRLIIDGNAVYEVDEDCMCKRRRDKAAGNDILKNGRGHAGQERSKIKNRKKR